MRSKVRNTRFHNSCDEIITSDIVARQNAMGHSGEPSTALCEQTSLHCSRQTVFLEHSTASLLFRPAAQIPWTEGGVSRFFSEDPAPPHEPPVKTALVDELAAPIRVVNCPRSRDSRVGQIRLLWREESVGAPRSVSLRNLVGFAPRGQVSLNACGVRPVQRRNDRWNAAGSEYWRKNAMSPMLRLRS